RVGTTGSDSNFRHRPDCRIPGRVRTTTRLWAPYDRPWPRAAIISTPGPHAARAVATTVGNPRVRLLAPSATTRATSTGLVRCHRQRGVGLTSESTDLSSQHISQHSAASAWRSKDESRPSDGGLRSHRGANIEGYPDRGIETTAPAVRNRTNGRNRE